MASALGIDFGTTNSVLAVAEGASTRTVVMESPAGKAYSTRTALSFLKGSGPLPLR
ncbi:molecular chaperone DnaK (HSP70) [Sinorhizobium kostiense]|uniref:Molecular chaperone DnaK (HSP70) n=1 Tax=Sinorhizobium kostiense TaxID=76747 RepID=A0ABS4QXA7_9HYPH|nr:molecular chaperone DnaK (HSP70) [Sinorhizobium kostiense]